MALPTPASPRQTVAPRDRQITEVDSNRPVARADPRSSPRFGPLARLLAGAALAPVISALAMLRSVSCRPEAIGVRVGSGQARQYQTGQPGSRTRAAPHGFAVPSDEPAAAAPPLANRRGETPRACPGEAFRYELETNRPRRRLALMRPRSHPALRVSAGGANRSRIRRRARVPATFGHGSSG
jgi:hypothetical protein